MDIPQISPSRVIACMAGRSGHCRGFTIVELIVVIMLLSILAAVVGMRWNAPSSTIPYEAERMARNLRHAQILAMNWGQMLQVEIAPPATYRVCAVTSAMLPCNGAAIADPAFSTGIFEVTLTNGITLLPGPATPLYFDHLGRPAANLATGALRTDFITYTLTTGSVTYSARVSPITGFVTVQSP